MVPKQDAIIVKFDFSNDQTVGGDHKKSLAL